MNGKSRVATTVTALFLGIFLGAIVVGVVLRASPAAAPVAAGEAGKYNRPYPMPHQYWRKTDEFYVFASGGQQGGLYIYALPSMKYLSEVPMFNVDEAWGWVPEDPKVRKMLTNPYNGELRMYGDTHHPSMSMTNGKYDGRFVFINDKINARIARMDVSTFRTGQILWIPNVKGAIHGTHIGPNTEILATNFEHEQVPDDAIVDLMRKAGVDFDPIKGPWLGGFAVVRIDPKTGTMTNFAQVWGPYQHDLLRVGHGKAEGWIVNTSYNTERAKETLGMFGSKSDYVYFWNIASIEKAVKDGKYVTTKMAPDVPVISYKDVEGFAVPIPLNPHGVDVSPTGQYALVSGKATSTITAVDIPKALAAYKAGKFTRDKYGLAVVDPKDAYAAQMDIGLGATHIEFDNEGYLYAGYFVDSDVKKVPLGPPYTEKHKKEPWKVVDTIPAHYSVGHLMVPGSDSVEPFGKYLVILNKLGKDTFLPHGPLITETHELYNIQEIPAKMIDQMPLGPETHLAVAAPVSLIEPRVKVSYNLPETYPDPSVEYDYDKKEVRVVMHMMRPLYNPPSLRVPQGWRVKIKLINVEEQMDMTHGFAVEGYDVATSIDPGEIRDVEFVADKPGLTWFYCTWFCSELHMEMRGYLHVIPESEWTKDLETKVS